MNIKILRKYIHKSRKTLNAFEFSQGFEIARDWINANEIIAFTTKNQCF